MRICSWLDHDSRVRVPVLGDDGGDGGPTEPFYVAIITPVTHYCMGGLASDAASACIGSDGKAIPDGTLLGRPLAAAWQCLGGNSLRDCGVLDRAAGLHATNTC